MHAPSESLSQTILQELKVPSLHAIKSGGLMRTSAQLCGYYFLEIMKTSSFSHSTSLGGHLLKLGPKFLYWLPTLFAVCSAIKASAAVLKYLILSLIEASPRIFAQPYQINNVTRSNCASINHSMKWSEGSSLLASQDTTTKNGGPKQGFIVENKTNPWANNTNFLKLWDQRPGLVQKLHQTRLPFSKDDPR